MGFKAFLMDWNTISSYSNDDSQLFRLTDRQIAILLSGTEYLVWRTRWANLPTNFDLIQQRSDLDLALMTPQTTPIDCNDIEACIIVSPTILAMQADIAQNTSDIASNTALIAQNTALINQNANDIVQNTLQINQNVLNIATNTNNINVNALAITQNQIDIQNNSDRITALENSGGGGDFETVQIVARKLIEVFAVGVDSDWFEFPIPQGAETVVIEALAYTSSLTATNLWMHANADEVNSNYRSVSMASGTGLSTPRIGRIPPPSARIAGVPPVNTIYLKFASESTPTMAYSDLAQTNATASSSMQRNGFTWNYETVAPITTVRMSAEAGQLLQGSIFRVYTETLTEVAVALEPNLWLLTFSGGEYIRLWTESGSGYPYVTKASTGTLAPPADIINGGNPDECFGIVPVSGSCVASDRIELYFYLIEHPETRNLTGIQFDYYLSSDIASTVWIFVAVTDTTGDTTTVILQNLQSETWTTVIMDSNSHPTILPTEIGNDENDYDVVIQPRYGAVYNANSDDIEIKIDNVRFEIS